ncbi:hypothetical protein D2S27_18740, partial [Bordetella pertussis]|nr:hypothetical protein [Bordetella pertussis]
RPPSKARRRPRTAAPPKGAKPAARAAKAAAKTQIAPRGQRIPWLGWTAFFLLFIGAAVLAFAYIVSPIEAGARCELSIGCI